jgi:CubicO group peptidase (beta-lactamase class C family)
MTRLQRALWLGLCCAALRPIAASAQPLVERGPSSSHAAELDRMLLSYRADSTHDLNGVVVQQHGRRLAEHYFNGDDAGTLHDIRSATKSITSTLVGIAIQQRAIPTIETRLGDLLPDALTPAQQRILLRDVLTMRAGLDAADQDTLSIGNEARLDASSDWMAFVRTVPLTSQPGKHYAYSSLTAFLAGRVVETQTHQDLQDFASRELFQPLGITRFAWRRGPRGEGVGQGNLSLTVRDMVSIGELFLRKGRHDGRQIIDSNWVAQALAALVPIGDVDRYADGYGYMWYQKNYLVGGQSVTVHFASGNGGNKIYVIPTFDAIVAISSSAYGRGYGQRRSEHILLRVLAVLGCTAQECAKSNFQKHE